MKIPREARKTARELFALATPSGKLNPDIARQIVNTLLSEKPRFYFPTLQYFTHLVQLELQRHHAIIESATPLPESARNSLAQLLTQRFGTQTTFDFRHNPDLLGGLRIQVGSDVWDGSIRAKLQALTANP